jgi:hypothetical protein
MFTKTVAIAIFAIAASMAFATAALSIATPVFADKVSGHNGVDTADKKIHEHQGLSSKTDQNFHKGTCSGGFDAGHNGICPESP